MEPRPAPRRRLTQRAHEAVSSLLHPGALAVDATMGNGHDTLFMARHVAPTGRVAAFDVQRQALGATRARLRRADLEAVVELQCVGHEHLETTLPANWHGKVDVVMFNLGYLPGGDKLFATRPETTLTALKQATRVLRPGGLMSLMLYHDHVGASSEVEGVKYWLATQSGRLTIREFTSPGPWLYLLSAA